MRSELGILTAFAVLIGCVLAPTAATGQTSDRGFRLGGIVSGTVGDGGASPAIELTTSYRPTPRVGLELDTSYVPKLDLGDFPNCPAGRVCVRGGTFSLHARAVSLSANVVSELPVRLPWMKPYVTAGGGVAHVRRDQRDNFFPIRSTTTSTNPTVMFGGGVDFMAGRKLGLGVDIRYQRVFTELLIDSPDIEPNLILTRLGASLSYRF
jgi:opacity protein-like surface antigen